MKLIIKLLIGVLTIEKSVQGTRLVQHTIQSSHIRIRDEIDKKIKAEELAQKELEIGNKIA